MWGTQESGAVELPGGPAAGRSETRKATSEANGEAGARDCHGERSVVRERVDGRQENSAGKSSGVEGKGGGREVYGVAGKPSGVGSEEEGRKAYGVAGNPEGERQGLGWGVE